MTGEKLKVINLFLILIKLTVSKFYALSEKSKVNFSVNQYLSKIDSLLEIHAPLKKLNKKKQTELSHQTRDYTKFTKFY